jgi:hypothetical protein
VYRDTKGKVWFTNFIAHSAVALVAYFAFGGFASEEVKDRSRRQKSLNRSIGGNC